MRQRGIKRKRLIKPEIRPPFIAKPPIYAKYRIEQLIDDFKERDVIPVEPETAVFGTENIVKRVYARSMEHDGKRWVRGKILPLKWGVPKMAERPAGTLDPFKSDYLVDVKGYGFFIWAWYYANAPVIELRIEIDGERYNLKYEHRASYLLQYWAGRGPTGRVGRVDEIGDEYYAFYQDVSGAKCFTRSLKVWLYNSSFTAYTAEAGALYTIFEE